MHWMLLFLHFEILKALYKLPIIIILLYYVIICSLESCLQFLVLFGMTLMTMTVHLVGLNSMICHVFSHSSREETSSWSSL